MLSRGQFYLLEIGAFLVCIGLAWATVEVLGHFGAPNWAKTIAILVFLGGSSSITDSGFSYRRYVANRGGPLARPPRWLASRNTLSLALVLAVVGLVAISAKASGSSDGSRWRDVAVGAWFVVPGAVMLYALTVRDWEREEKDPKSNAT